MSTKWANINNRGWRSEARATEPTDTPLPSHRPRRGRTNAAKKSSGWFAPFGDGDFWGPARGFHRCAIPPTVIYIRPLRGQFPALVRDEGEAEGCGMIFVTFGHLQGAICKSPSQGTGKALRICKGRSFASPSQGAGKK
jgi:hypothetical protein